MREAETFRRCRIDWQLIAVILVWLLIPQCAIAQGLYVPPVRIDTSNLATKADIAALQAQVPQPASAIPPTEQPGGAIGSPGTYRPADAVQPRITRAGTTTTDSMGNWSIAWSTPLSATPVVLPVPVDAGSQPVMCAVAERTSSGASGRCWRSQLLPATITLLSALANFNVLGGAASGVMVEVLAIPPTQ